MFTTVLDLLALVLLLAFGWLVWPPLMLLVAGAACLAASRSRQARR